MSKSRKNKDEEEKPRDHIEPTEIDESTAPGSSPESKNTIQITHWLDDMSDYITRKFDIKFNTLTLAKEVFDKFEGKFLTPGQIKSFSSKIRYDMIRVGFSKVNKDLLTVIVDNQCYKNQYNPVKEYVDLLVWDGKTTISSLFDTITFNTDFVNQDEIEFLKGMCVKWLVAMVGSCMEMNANELCIVLFGEGGAGKSLLLKTFVPPKLKKFVLDAHMNPKTTDRTTADALAEKVLWILNDSLREMLKKHSDAFKGILSLTEIENRKPYAEEGAQRIKICTLAGSVDKSDVFQDLKNRRFIVVPVKSINPQHTINVEQVWARAAYLRKTTAFDVYMTPDEMAKLNDINGRFRSSSLEEDILFKYWRKPTEEELSIKDNPIIVPMSYTEIFMQVQSYAGNSKIDKDDFKKALEVIIGSHKMVRVWVGDKEQPRNMYLVVVREHGDDVKPIDQANDTADS